MARIGDKEDNEDDWVWGEVGQERTKSENRNHLGESLGLAGTG